jgi:hypothetical protein
VRCCQWRDPAIPAATALAGARLTGGDGKPGDHATSNCLISRPDW